MLFFWFPPTVQNQTNKLPLIVCVCVCVWPMYTFLSSKVQTPNNSLFHFCLRGNAISVNGRASVVVVMVKAQLCVAFKDRLLFKRALLLTRADAANWTGIDCCKCWASVYCITEFRESKRNSVCMKCSCASSSLASLFNELTKGKNKYNVSQLRTNHKQWQQWFPFAMRRGGEDFWKYKNIWICSLQKDYCCIHVCFWLCRPYLLPFIHFNDSALLISRVWWIMATGRKTGNVWSTGTWWNNDWCGWSHIHVPGPTPSAVACLSERSRMKGVRKRVQQR